MNLLIMIMSYIYRFAKDLYVYIISLEAHKSSNDRINVMGMKTDNVCVSTGTWTCNACEKHEKNGRFGYWEKTHLR